jgi:hypothetical protein
MPEGYQSYGQPTNVVVWGWQNLCRKEQVPDRNHPVCDNH